MICRVQANEVLLNDHTYEDIFVLLMDFYFSTLQSSNFSENTHIRISEFGVENKFECNSNQ